MVQINNQSLAILDGPDVTKTGIETKNDPWQLELPPGWGYYAKRHSVCTIPDLQVAILVF
jgi:hypothetical protein